MSVYGNKIIRYIQETLYEGRQPDESGYYRYSKKELAEGAKISESTVNAHKLDLVFYFKDWMNFKRDMKYDEYPDEQLYIDVEYARGELRFKRNPLTLNGELKRFWGLKPIYSTFTYDCFDEKHRRRGNSSAPQFDEFPWSWTEEQIQEYIKENGDYFRDK